MKEPNETWKPVSEYEGLYEVSSCGRVRSLPRNTTRGKVLQPIERNEYVAVNLWKNGKSTLCSVHRLVAEAFVPNPCMKPMVNHIDENKKNNAVENLEWCTHKENCRHGTATQRMREHMKNHPKKSKAVEQYSKCGVYIKTYQSIREAERQGVALHKDISFCCQGKRTTAGGYKWKYANQ